MAERQAKLFAEMLNKALDELDMPSDLRERGALLARLLGIGRDKARILLNGYALPKEDVYLKMVDELGVQPDWLASQNEHEADSLHE